MSEPPDERYETTLRLLNATRELLDTERARYAHMALKANALEKRVERGERLARALADLVAFAPKKYDPGSLYGQSLHRARAALHVWEQEEGK